MAVILFGARSAHALACKPEKTKTRYVVCVVDEAGKPVKGAVVTAVRELMHEGYGDIGFSDEQLGTVTTDAAGRAVFAVPKIERHWLVASREFRRRATAEVQGWPVQGTWEDDGTIILGPLRSVVIRNKVRQCDGTASIMIHGPQGAHQPDATELRDGEVTVELGPGEYLIQHRFCHEKRDASTQRVVRGKDLGKALDL
jgi:hypothetical protein